MSNFKSKLDKCVRNESMYCNRTSPKAQSIFDKQFFKGQQFIYTRLKSILPYKTKGGILSWLRRRKEETSQAVKDAYYSDPYSHGYENGKDAALDKVLEFVNR